MRLLYTVATTCINRVIWSSSTAGVWACLLLHISQYNLVFEPLQDYESAAKPFITKLTATLTADSLLHTITRWK